MWMYEKVSREDFEKIKDKVEKMIQILGGKKVDIELPYIQKTTTYSGKNFENVVENISSRSVYEFEGLFYRVDEVCYSEKPFIVFECGTREDVLRNSMEDLEPFPYDLNEDEIRLEVEYALQLKPYPC